MSGSGTDCAECRALLALLVGNEDRAYREVRILLPGERAALARASRWLADLCDDESALGTWGRSGPMSGLC